jgi:hypothetical protein
MANNLNEDIEGKHVILMESWFKDPAVAADVRERVFLAEGGFGCSPHTMGNAVTGQFIVEGPETYRVEGYHIERFATDIEIAAAVDKRERWNNS